jgi:hypothetical protein
MGAPMKWRFAGVFLLTFAMLVTLWWAFDVARLYRGAVLAAVQLLSPVVNGWWLDYDRPGMPSPVMFRFGDRQLAMLLQLPALSMSLMPFVALVVATPGLGLRRTTVTIVIGSVLFFLIHLTVVLLYPLIMDDPNVFKDTLGVFSGLVAFVVAPLGLWFVLTYSTLRSVWRLTPGERSTQPQRQAPGAVARRVKPRKHTSGS